MAQGALLYARVIAPHHQLHLDVPHGVTRRREVTLSAIGRARRGVTELGQRPFGQPMAARTGGSERTTMAVLRRMA